MNHAKRAYRSQAEWQTIIDQQIDSDLSARHFCQVQNVNYVSFCNWRRKLDKPNKPVPLIDLSSLMANPNNPGWHIELDLGAGIKLNFRQA